MSQKVDRKVFIISAIWLTIATICWSLPPALGALIGETITPVFIAWFRLLFASILLLVIFIPQKAVMKEFKNLAHLSKQDIWFLIIAGALEGIHYVFYFYSLHYTSAVAVSILNNVGEVFVAISGFIFFKEKITKGFVFAIFLAIVGTLITITNGDFTQLNTIFSSEAALGDLLILIAAFLFSLYAVIEKKVITRIGLVPLVAVTFFIGQLVLLPFTIPDIANAGSIPTFSWLLLIIIAIFGSAVGYYAFTKGIAISDMSIAGMITLSGPIFAILFAIIFVPGESLDLSQALGAILIIISIFLVTTKHKSKSSENEASSNIKTPKDDLFNDEVLNIETN